MGRPEEPYYTIVVETHRISGSGLHGGIHVRPAKGEQFPQGGNPFLHTNHAWDYEVLPPDES